MKIREQVIQGLYDCSRPGHCNYCPYKHAYKACAIDLMADAYDYLRQACKSCLHYREGQNELDSWMWCKYMGRDVEPDFFCGYWEEKK